jgi:hypothetical protein
MRRNARGQAYVKEDLEHMTSVMDERKFITNFWEGI